MHCPRCKMENPEAARFCMSCGARLTALCPQCRATLPPEARFCVECGAQVGPRPPDTPLAQALKRLVPREFAKRLLATRGQVSKERRVVTILFSDVRGSTPMAEHLDPEEVAEIMNGAFEVLIAPVTHYEGALARLMGDGILAFFGAPIAHEDDAERACRAAREIIEGARAYAARLEAERGIAGFNVRVGIHTGLVVVGEVGSDLRVEYTAMGDAVNLASRMEKAAEPGTVLITEDTHRLIAPLFETEALGPIQVKGRAEPVAVYRVLASKPVAHKPRGIVGLESPLVGREAEFRALQEALERLRAGIGGIATIVGEAGIGKSRLVAELRREAAPLGLRWVQGRCLSYGSSISYLPWLEVLRTLLGVTPDDPPAVVQEGLRERVESMCPDSPQDVHPYLARMMSLPLQAEEEALLRNMEGEALKSRTFRAVERTIACAADGHPLILFCEDLHWADPTSLELLEQLLGLTDRCSLLLMCAFRPYREHGCWRIREAAARLYPHRHTDLWLEPLSTADSQILVGNLLRMEALPSLFRERILDHAEGNPLYVEEVIRSLIDSQAIVYDGTTRHWQAAQEVQDIAIPDTLQGVLMARIDRLQEESRRVLQLASVIGRIFLYRVLAAIAQEVQQLDAQLLTLQREEMIRERARVPELEYIFKHHLTQEAAYSGLLRRERRRFHRQVAEALERLYPARAEQQCGLLAHHWERAEEPQKAIAYLLSAGNQARMAYANEEAIDYYQRVLALLEDSSLAESRKHWRLEALRGLGQTHFGIGEVDEAEECFREMVALGQEMRLAPRKLVRLYFWLGEIFFWQDRHDDQRRIGEEGLALLGDDTESVEAALMNQFTAIGHFGKGNVEGWREFTHRTAQFVRRLPYSEELRPVYEHIVWMYLYQDKNAEEATRWLRTFEERATQYQDLRALGTADLMAGRILDAQGDLHGAIAQYQRALETYTRIGDTKHASWCLARMGWDFLSLGNLQEAEQHAYRGLESAKAVGYKRELAEDHQLLGLIPLCRGDWEKAINAFQKALQVWQKTSDRWRQAYPTYLLGRAYLAQGSRGEALRRFQEATALVEPESVAGVLIGLLSGCEEAYDDPQAFRAFCRRFQEKYPQVKESPLVQWFLVPAETLDFPQKVIHDDFVAPVLADWAWHDPFGDCSFKVQNGLEIHAANGRGLGDLNLSAPHILRPVSPALSSGLGESKAHIEGQDFAVQTVCAPVSEDKPAIGGILVWKDEENYLRLERGRRGTYEVALEGCIRNRDMVIGRGRLSSERLFLRLERLGGRVRALCSADGDHWCTVGQVEFSAEDPLEVGLHAIGDIDRTIYHGAFPEGTAICFEYFQLWRA